jgi:nitrite reductase/ring-hydroxylating ferredoxin subunit
MSDERPGQAERPDRVNRVVDDLMKGRRPRVGPGDAPERRELLMAARLTAARESRPHMAPGFRRRLAMELQGKPVRTFPTRRAALVAGVGLAVGAVAGVKIGQQQQVHPPVASTMHTAVPPTYSPSPRSGAVPVIDPRPGRWVDVAALADLPEGQAFRVNMGSFSAYLVRQGDKVSGVSSICSHLPCELDSDPRRSLLVCPCHNQSFDLDGKPTRDDYPVPYLARIRVQVENGRVQVRGV